jgi:WD40 repeat protein
MNPNLASSQISEMIFSDGPTPGFVRIWDFAREPASESAHFDVLSERVFTDPSSVAFSPGGRLLAASTFHGTLWLCKKNGDVWSKWRLLKTEPGLSVPVGVPDGRSRVGFTRDGKMLIWATLSGTVQRFDVSGEEPVRLASLPPQQQPTDWIQDVAIGPDGEIAWAGKPERLVLWDAEGRALREWKVPGTDFRRATAFSPDGRLLAAANGTRSVYLFRVPKE